ncbi:MAG TPA: substrate-binding domain-containing protein [Dongiaceae bacterium]
MSTRRTLLSLATATVAMTAASLSADATDPSKTGPLGAGMTMYFQMGGNPGDGATLPRQTGAADAAAAFGIKVIEQFSAWAPEKMLDQFREAVAAKPTCIEIMGHPGNDAFQDLVADAEKQGIIVTSGNAPLTQLAAQYQPNGFGYAGVDLYTGGQITAEAMLKAGLKSGDRALVYGLLSEGERGLSTKGIKDTLEKAGVKVDYLDISPDVNSDSSLAVPILVAYIAKHPDLKAIGTEHGGVTSFLGKALEQAGKKPGDIIIGGIDLAPSTIDGLKSKYITAVLDQQLYLQGFLPVMQCVLSANYHFTGLSINTGSGTVTPDTINDLIPLIDKGIR